MKKTRDPYPITDVYHVTYNLVDGATVTVTDLCENLSNDFDTHDEGIVDEMTNADTRKFNSVSVSNGADGAYPVWLGVDKFHKVRKIFANTNESNTSGFFDNKNNHEYISWSFHKSDLNDQFFEKKDHNLKRLKLFDININSSAIYVGDHGGNFRYEHHDEVVKYIDEKYFKENGIYQRNYPLGLYKFTYGSREVSKPSSFSKSKIHDEKAQGINKFKDVNYNEFLSNLLNEKQYPTKYIFDKYLIEDFDYKNVSEFILKDKRDFANYLLKRLPKAIEILKIQTKILFPKKFKEVFELRKNQFEDFIFSIIKDIEPQELNLPTFNRPEKKLVNNNKLWFEKVGLPTVQDTLFEGFKLKSETSLKETVIIPVKNGKYPCYVHSYPSDTGEDDFKYNVVNIVIEGIEECYLNKNNLGQLVFNKNYKESGLIRDHIKNKSKKIKIDQIDLRDSESTKELEKINFVEELELHGLMSIKSWKSLSKLKSLKKLKLVSCEVNGVTSKDFFENLYSLNKLEEFIIDDSCHIIVPTKDEISKNLYPKNLKTYTIEFRENWKKGDEEYPKNKGYGDSGLDFLYNSLPNIYKFPNFEKFKYLEKLKIYNYFDYDQKEGTLFSYEFDFEDYFESINKLCKNSNIKDIWIYGYNFNKSNELASTRFLNAALKLTKDTKVKVNGISQNTLKNINEKPISSTSFKLKKLILENKIEEFYGDKLISQKNDSISLNYFASLEDQKNEGTLLNDILNQQIEEIVIKTAYQFFRSENIYSDTIKPIKDHIKKNKKLRKIIFEFDGAIVDGHADMEGSWGSWENELLGNTIINLVKENKNLEIAIRFSEFKNESKDIDLQKLKDFGEFLIVFLIKTLQKNPIFRNRIYIIEYDSKKIEQIISSYLKDKVEGIIVIGDQSYQEDKNFDDIEILTRSMFEIGELKRTAATVPISYESGDKNYSEFWSRFIENFHWYDGKNFIVESFKHDWQGHGDNTIIFVKESFLNKSNKVIFKNIKNYFYFAQSVYDWKTDFDRLYKQNDKLRMPASIRFNKPELIYLDGGGKLKFEDFIKQVDVSALKDLYLLKVLDTDLDIPFMQNLESLYIQHRINEDSNIEIWGDRREKIINHKENDKKITYSGFKNLPKLKKLIITNLKAECIDKKDKYKNQQAKIDFHGIKVLKNLNKVTLGGYDYKDLSKCSELKNVEELNFHSLDSDPERVVSHETFNFLKKFTNLKKFSLDVSHMTNDGIFFRHDLFLNNLNKNVEKLSLSINLQNKQELYNFHKYLAKRFKRIKIISFHCNIIDDGSKVIDPGYSGDRPNWVDEKTGKKFVYNKGPNPVIFDLNIFKNLNNLEELDTLHHDANGFKIKNLLTVLKIKRIKKLKLDGAPEVYSTKDLIKIDKVLKKPALAFLKHCKKNNIKIKDKYDLEGNDWKKYQKLDREIQFGYGTSSTAEEIIKDRKNKN